MKVSIIVPDHMVVVDGVERNVSMADVLPGVHAVQWDGRKGDVELMEPIRANVTITDLSPYQFLVDRWTAAAPVPMSPSPPFTKDDMLARTLADPTMDALVTVLATRLNMTSDALKTAIMDNMK